MRLSRFGALALTGLFVAVGCSGAKSSPVPSAQPGGVTNPTTGASTTPASMAPSSMAPSSMAPSSMAPASMGNQSMAPMSMSPQSPAASAGSGGATDSAAASLRVDLNYFFGEHLMLTTKATDAALGGRTDEFNSYADLVGQNGTDIGAYLGTLYGQGAQDQFNQIWTAHIGYFVDYTKAVAAKDDTAKAHAQDELDNQYTPQFTDFIVGATGLPQDAVMKLVSEHVTTTEAVIDAQASGDWPKAYDALRTAYAHMSMIGDALAPAIATKNNLAGDPMTAAVGFRTALDQLLQEHLYLTTFATDAAIAGRTDEYKAAADALSANGTELGSAVGKVYGQDAQDQFNQIWTDHIGYFVAYTTAVATNDDSGKQQALDDLNNKYVPAFAQFLAGATGLPETDLAALTADHVATTVAVIDAQASGDQTAASQADRTAGMHMRMIGDPLAAAIVAAKPDAFK